MIACVGVTVQSWVGMMRLQPRVAWNVERGTYHRSMAIHLILQVAGLAPTSIGCCFVVVLIDVIVSRKGSK